jgi:hypothetical protein
LNLCALNDNFLGMKNSIIFISALSLVAMMLASCEAIPEGFSDSYNPLPGNLAPPTASTPDHSEGEPVPGETLKPRP